MEAVIKNLGLDMLIILCKYNYHLYKPI